MKVVQVEIPEPLAQEMDELVKAGWFSSDTEIARLALLEFLQRHSFVLMERFQRDDIAWALRQRETGKCGIIAAPTHRD